MSDNTDDLELLAALRDAVVAADPPPARLRDAAMRALTWDAEMETLLATFDSAKEPAGMRSAVATRDLTFGADELVIDVSVTTDGPDGPTLTGSVSVPDASLTLARPGHPDQPITIDEFGRFHLPVSGSLAGIVVLTADGRSLRTELFSLDPADPG